MSVQKPKSLSIEEFVRSATMFYIDPVLEAEYAKTVDSQVAALQTKLLGIATPGGLEKYVREDPEALDNITSLLNISEEKFKRIITMLRIEKRHTPTSEWTLGKVREQMISSPYFMQEICDLLSHGATMEKYAALIPAFYLENFMIDASTLGRLASADDIRRLVKKGMEGGYNNKLGDSYFNAVAKVITDYCDRKGLTYDIKKSVPVYGKVMSIAIPSASNPRIVIDITYGITTSSTQTKYAERAEAVASKIRVRNEGRQDRDKYVFINIVDGAGWVARQSDLNKLERCSDILTNLKNLSIVEVAIDYYLLED